MTNEKEIINILKDIQTRLDNIELMLKEQKESSRKMDEHIEFIDSVYDTVKKPFCKALSIYNGQTVIIDKKRSLCDSHK